MEAGLEVEGEKEKGGSKMSFRPTPPWRGSGEILSVSFMKAHGQIPRLALGMTHYLAWMLWVLKWRLGLGVGIGC